MRTHEVSSSSCEASIATDRLRDGMIEPKQRTPQASLNCPESEANNEQIWDFGASQNPEGKMRNEVRVLSNLAIPRKSEPPMQNRRPFRIFKGSYRHSLPPRWQFKHFMKKATSINQSLLHFQAFSIWKKRVHKWSHRIYEISAYRWKTKKSIRLLTGDFLCFSHLAFNH